MTIATQTIGEHEARPRGTFRIIRRVTVRRCGGPALPYPVKTDNPSPRYGQV
jgi:hypothetical protein